MIRPAVLGSIVVVGLVVMCATPSAQTQSFVPETYADLGDARLWYRDTGGSGAPVVFLHAANRAVLEFLRKHEQ